jgi:hypothetical protein
MELMEITQASFSRLLWQNPMGEARKDALRLDFDHKLKLEFHGTKVTSDAGLLAYQELDEALGLIAMIHPELRDIRPGKNTQHGVAAMLRQAIYSLILSGLLCFGVFLEAYRSCW